MKQATRGGGMRKAKRTQLNGKEIKSNRLADCIISEGRVDHFLPLGSCFLKF
jgi:hypothetical protein